MDSWQRPLGCAAARWDLGFLELVLSLKTSLVFELVFELKLVLVGSSANRATGLPKNHKNQYSSSENTIVSTVFVSRRKQKAIVSPVSGVIPHSVA